jgi:hypothetical protein
MIHTSSEDAQRIELGDYIRVVEIFRPNAWVLVTGISEWVRNILP